MIAETDDAHSSSPGLASRGMHSNGAAMTGLPAAGHTSGSRMSGPASATNGTSKAAQNGSRNRNGKAPATPYRGHNREEVTRLLIQSLVDLGYHNAAAIVSEESGYSLENADVAAFRHAVSTGLWQEAEALLFGAAAAQTRVEDSDHGIVLIAGADPDHMRFLLRQQKFLELLENRDTTMALHVLQKELTPLCQDMQRLHFLSSLLMCGAPSDVRNEAVWDGAGGKSRQHLLSELSKCISPSVMLPEHRLATLLHQANASQVARCFYHSDASPPSLYSDHMCSRQDFPFDTVEVLDKHDGEVWQVKFSHDGKRLASCGSDKYVLIWDVPSFKVALFLCDHEDGIGNMDWSPDDSMLVTCCQDNYARLWDTKTGNLIRKLDRQTEPVSGCAWLADGRSFVLSSLDLTGSITHYNVAGQKVADWGKKHRVEDIVLSPNQKWLIAMTDRQTVHVYDFSTKTELRTLDLQARTYSVSISADSRHLLVNTKKGDLKLYDTSTWDVIQQYKSAPGEDCIIRCGFGGANESFIVCGGEDGEVLICHKTTGVVVYSLPAHNPRCNSVCWNPTDARMFATGGDDGRVKIWSTKAHLEYLSSASRSLPSNGWDGEEAEL